MWGGWTPTYTKEVTGNWYIDLTDAVVNKLLELKAYGGCTQASTPTPTTPVDIVCNNWALKVRKESWLPFRYKKVEYITASSTQWLNTWIKLASTDIVEAEYKNSSTTWYWALYWVFAMWDSSAFYANWTYYWYDVSNDKVNTWVSVDTSRHTLRHDFANWIITLDDTTTTFTPFTFDNSKYNYLFSRYYWSWYWYWFKWSCRKYKIYRWWELICDLVPVIDTQNNDEPWMYDLVSGEFKWNVWTWNFTAWAEAQDDIEVYVEWTKEKVWYSGWATATCEDLLWVWTYKDEQEILSGNVVVKNVVMVLDWTENWSQATTSQGVYRYRFEPTYEPKIDGGRWPCVSTHFVDISGVTTQDVGGVFVSTTYLYFIPNQDVDTVAKWTTFLANQLSAWTPVIVVYALATPTTLSVAWQSLSIPAWNSRIEIVEWSILNLPLYAKYKSTSE